MARVSLSSPSVRSLPQRSLVAGVEAVGRGVVGEALYRSVADATSYELADSVAVKALAVEGVELLYRRRVLVADINMMTVVVEGYGLLVLVILS